MVNTEAWVQTWIKGIVETAIANQYHVPIAFTHSTMLRNKTTNFTIKVNDDYVVEFKKWQQMFVTYVFSSKYAGVYYTNFTPSGNFGKTQFIPERSEGLLQNYTQETLYNSLVK